MTDSNVFRWHGQVVDSDLDAQEIVNHACFITYCHRARVALLKSKGLDWETLHHEGIDTKVYHIDLTLKASLRANDQFYIDTTYTVDGPIKIIFSQKIFLQNEDKLIAAGKITLVCVSVETGKPLKSSVLGKLVTI